MEYVSLIKTPIEAELSRFNALFDSTLQSSNPLLAHVIAHIRQRNGKQMRPMLVLLVAKLCGQGQVSDTALHAAFALELLHTASLVHDDVVDESAQRRGQLSVNAAFNNKVAVLSGDYLLSTALVQVSLTRHLDIFKLISVLGQELADGELLQLANVSNPTLSEEVYFDIIRKKTASLFAACTKAGALSAAASDEMVETMRLFGEYIGLCFQIKDDIFDYAENPALGKPTGNDMREGKLTLPALYALRQAPDEAALQWASKVKEGVATTDEIDRLVTFTRSHGGIDYAIRRMEELRLKALSLLAPLPDSTLKQALEAYLNYVVEREL